MLYSKLFTKTSKDIPSDENCKNAKLLIQAGFVDKTMAGVYAFLPLGLKVLNKIENIVRNNLNQIGGQEILMPSLSPKDNWTITKRWKEIPEYFCLPSQSGTEYRLNPTHEEVVSPLISKLVSTYKDLPKYEPKTSTYPLSVYQIQTKFRDELRSKSGLLRGREFRMKDMYDFHPTKESQEEYFELITKTYHKIFQEIGLKSYAVDASGGDFSDKFSREFQAVCPAGEDVIMYSKSTGFACNQEVFEESKAKWIKSGKDWVEDIETATAAEIGNIFDLGQKWVKAFEINYTDQHNQKQYPYMGCHGIGTSRCMAVVAEIYNDEKGLKWPESITPFEYHLITNLNSNETEEVNSQILDIASRIYKGLIVVEKHQEQFELRDLTSYLDPSLNIDISKYIKNNENVFWDDRAEVSLGYKLKDADLMGMPYQLVVSKRSLEQGGIELITRATGHSQILKIA
jgi:prolyl-tRNA synthetase